MVPASLEGWEDKVIVEECISVPGTGKLWISISHHYPDPL